MKEIGRVICESILNDWSIMITCLEVSCVPEISAMSDPKNKKLTFISYRNTWCTGPRLRRLPQHAYHKRRAIQ
jgi:hypothetical protein